MQRVGSWALLEADHAEQTVEIILRSRSIEELVGLAVGRRAATELDPPKLVDHDGLVLSIDYGSNEGSGGQVEAVDGAGVGVVADQQSVAEGAEVRGGNGESPGLVEGCARDEGLHEGAIFLKDINVSAGATIGSGESDIDLAANVLNAEGGEASGKVRVGERGDELEGAVVNVDLIVGKIRRIEKVAGRFAGNRKAGVRGAGT